MNTQIAKKSYMNLYVKAIVVPEKVISTLNVEILLKIRQKKAGFLSPALNL
jgi:hypothetical protein